MVYVVIDFLKYLWIYMYYIFYDWVKFCLISWIYFVFFSFVVKEFWGVDNILINILLMEIVFFLFIFWINFMKIVFLIVVEEFVCIYMFRYMNKCVIYVKLIINYGLLYLLL